MTLDAEVRASYEPSEFPALHDQRRRWAIERPLVGMRVLDATPIWRNTLPKYAALLAGGADLVVATHRDIPADPEITAMLPELGIEVAAGEGSQAFDVVLDCAGFHARLPTRLGFVELTRSGAAAYAGCPLPAVLVDAGRVKLIEDSLGTGDGFVRAMTALGHGGLEGRPVLVVGAGKVGRGIARAARRCGAHVTLVDDPATVPQVLGCPMVDRFDEAAVAAAIGAAWCVVTATGVAGAMAAYAGDLAASQALIANMGVADEFGPGLPAGRVLNGKRPLNFILPEPTRLRYIDPSLALSNAAAVEIVQGRVAPGLHPPSEELERAVLAPVLAHGTVAPQLTSELAIG